MLSWLRTRGLDRRKAGELYGAVVAQARDPAFYGALGVADRPEGRYEMIVLHLFLLLERLRVDGSATSDRARGVIEAFVTDMDDCMREFGVGDLAVPRKVKRAAAGLYERAAAYRAALAHPDPAVLADRLAEHALSGNAAGAVALAGYSRRATAHLAGQSTADLLVGRLSFPARPPRRRLMSEPLDWSHALGEIGETGLARERRASEAERAALARALDILAVTDLRAVYEIQPLARGRYQLTGDIEASVTQSCVVTLEPVDGRVAERFEAEFMPAGELAGAERQEEEMEALAAADLEPIVHERIEVGRVVYEQVAAALDPYPRKDGARLEQPGASESGRDESGGPFAALAKLRPRR